MVDLQAGRGGAPQPSTTAEARAKRRLLRWRPHLLLAQRSGSLAHADEAVLARPDLPRGQAVLGQALLRDGQPAEAAAHLQGAPADNPLDRDAARALSRALAGLGDAVVRQALIQDRQLLTRAAPGLVPAEPWFAGMETVPTTAAPAAAAPRPMSLTTIVKNAAPPAPRRPDLERRRSGVMRPCHLANWRCVRQAWERRTRCRKHPRNLSLGPCG
jgi:hypothetical protein